MLSCEGTRFTENKRVASMQIAREKGLPELKHHILPRTKGFTLLLQGAENRSKFLILSRISDSIFMVQFKLSMILPWVSKRREPSLLCLASSRVARVKRKCVSGQFVSCYFSHDHRIWIRRIPISEIPTDTEGSGRWVHELYREKDDIFDYFDKHGTFEGNGIPRVDIPRNYNDLLILLGWVIIIGIPSVIYFVQFLWTSSLWAQLILGLIIGLSKNVALSSIRP